MIACEQAPGEEGKKFGERETEEWVKRSGHTRNLFVGYSDDNCCKPETRVDAIMVGRCHGDDTFVAFQPMRIFPFLEKREIHFF